MNKKFVWALPVALLLTACGGTDEVGTSEGDSTNVEITPVPTVPETPTMPGYTKTESGLQYIIHSKGDGVKVQEGDALLVHYKGNLAADESEFDNSYRRGKPLWLLAGRGFVIPGWDEGLSMLNVGDSVSLYIPSDLGYGPQGMPPVIPGNADLKFTMKIVEREGPYTYFITEEDYTTTKSGLKIAKAVENPNGRKLKSGNEVRVDYVGYFEDGRPFDASYFKGQPYAVKIDETAVIEGWHEALKLMRVGEKARVIIPAELGYGQQGSGPIPPNTTLIFDLSIPTEANLQE